VKAPSRDSSDFGIAHRAESALFIPEKAKSSSTPERGQHVRTFSFFEIGFIGGIVRVCFAFDLNVSLDGRATGAAQPELARLPLVIACFTEERPVAPPVSPKVFLFEPIRGLLFSAPIAAYDRR
jgi:hypothetical protein